VRFVLLGNPGKRTDFFQAALAGEGLPPARLVTWLEFLDSPGALAEALDQADALRVDSFGRSLDVERELIARGAAGDLGSAERIDPDGARALPEDKGRVRYLRQHHAGVRAALGDLASTLEGRPLPTSHTPAAIGLMFDKPRCQARLAEAGVSVPRAIPGVTSFEGLRGAMADAGLRRVFVKASHGSSASGVVALAVRPPRAKGPEVVARTTMELVREDGAVRFYNSRRVLKYTDPADVAAVVDYLTREGAQVEEWLPKADLGGKSCDLRLVVIDGQAQHAVVRTSDGPFTNLHLKNPRGDLDAFVRLLGPERWSQLQRLGEAALAAVGGARYAGVDLMVARGLGRQAVLEVNAFGDLLPRVMVDGCDTYTAEVRAMRATQAMEAEE
jgi:hypothetical protein